MSSRPSDSPDPSPTGARLGPLAEALAEAGVPVFFPGERGGFWRLRSPDLVAYTVEDARTHGQVWLPFDDHRGRRLSVVSSRADGPPPPPGEKPWNIEGGAVVYVSGEDADEVHARIVRGGAQVMLVAEAGITVDELIALATSVVPVS